MEKFNRFTSATASLMSGATITSLLITHSDTWKYSLSVLLLIVTLRMFIHDNTNE